MDEGKVERCKDGKQPVVRLSAALCSWSCALHAHPLHFTDLDCAVVGCGGAGGAIAARHKLQRISQPVVVGLHISSTDDSETSGSSSSEQTQQAYQRLMLFCSYTLRSNTLLQSLGGRADEC